MNSRILLGALSALAIGGVAHPAFAGAESPVEGFASPIYAQAMQRDIGFGRLPWDANRTVQVNASPVTVVANGQSVEFVPVASLTPGPNRG